MTYLKGACKLHNMTNNSTLFLSLVCSCSVCGKAVGGSFTAVGGPLIEVGGAFTAVGGALTVEFVHVRNEGCGCHV